MLEKFSLFVVCCSLQLFQMNSALFSQIIYSTILESFCNTKRRQTNAIGIAIFVKVNSVCKTDSVLQLLLVATNSDLVLKNKSNLFLKIQDCQVIFLKSFKSAQLLLNPYLRAKSLSKEQKHM